MYKYITILYEIFLIKFVYCKTTSFYIKKYFFLCKIISFYYKQIRLKNLILYIYIFIHIIYIYIIYIYIIYIYIYNKKIQFFRLTELIFAKIEIRTEKIE